MVAVAVAGAAAVAAVAVAGAAKDDKYVVEVSAARRIRLPTRADHFVDVKREGLGSDERAEVRDVHKRRRRRKPFFISLVKALQKRRGDETRMCYSGGPE